MGFCGARFLEQTSRSFENGWIRKFQTADAVPTYEPFDQLSLPGVDTPEYFKKEVRTAAQMTYGELKDTSRTAAERHRCEFLDCGFESKAIVSARFLHMAIIGIPFSFTTGKKGAFYGIGLCVVVGIFYWSTFELFDKLGGINRLSPLIAAWFPNLIFGFGGLWMMLRVEDLVGDSPLRL